METLQKRPPEASCDEPPWPDPLPAAQSPAFDMAIAFGSRVPSPSPAQHHRCSRQGCTFGFAF